MVQTTTVYDPQTTNDIFYKLSIKILHPVNVYIKLSKHNFNCDKSTCFLFITGTFYLLFFLSCFLSELPLSDRLRL